MKVLKITVLSILVLISFATWYLSYRTGLATIYNDAMSHLNIARAVVDNKQPGLAQLGSVWLPLNHILFLALIWNTWAWHSGFAGSFFSMLSYIFGAIGIYKIIDELTDNFIASVIGAMAFALNLNILYLQTTPLTEPLYLFFFIFSVLFFIKFIKTDNLRYLLLMGLFGMFQVLTRYDGWFVVLIEGLLLIYQQRFVRKASFQDIIGKFLIFAIPVIFGAALWFLWNWLIFGDPLYFMFGPYSAHAQQLVIQNSVGLITKGNLRISILAYWYAISDNIGNYLILLASLGIILFLGVKSKLLNLENKLVVFLILLAPILFNIIALYLGFSILNLPELHWDPSGDPSQQWFNVRYGIMALPLVAVFVGLLAEKIKKRPLALLIILVIIGQALVTYNRGIITITDGTKGSSNSIAYGDVANILSENVTPNENILISTASYSSVIFKSNFPIERFITEGDSSEWQEALAEPQNYANWVVMGNGDLNDSVYSTISKNDLAQFSKNYTIFYCNPKICLYEKRAPAQMFVYANGTNLKVGDTNFIIKGVNSYDLAYKSKPEIDATLKNLSSIGVNTVRFWMFGDGNQDGFQPTAGVINEARLENADYLIAEARSYNIRLIPVLVNNWTDYGGEQQYLNWTGQNPNDQDLFYTDPETIKLFENYINHIVPRRNTVNGIPYDEDPTIMAWEIVNEPRFSNNDSQAFVKWFSGVASYIRNEDPNHMITVETDQTAVGTGGQLSISDYCSRLPVDFCSAHLYLYDNTTPIYSTLNAVESNIQQYINIANKDNKPFMLGEVGISKETSPFGENPVKVLKAILSSNQSSGALIWNWSDKPDTSFGFSPNGTDGVYNLSDLSNVLGGELPSTVYLATNASNEGGYDVSLPGIEETSTILSSSTSVSTPQSTTSSTASLTPPQVTPITTPSSATILPITPDELQIPYVENNFTDNGWQDRWGTMIVDSSNFLNIGTDASDTSSRVILPGSLNWTTNYTFSATLDWIKGESFGLITQYTDDNDYTVCDFNEAQPGTVYMALEQFINGTQHTLVSGEIDNYNEYGGPSIGAYVRMQGNIASCSFNDHVITTQYGDTVVSPPFSGGIGFLTWDPQAGNSEITVKSATVQNND